MRIVRNLIAFIILTLIFILLVIGHLILIVIASAINIISRPLGTCFVPRNDTEAWTVNRLMLLIVRNYMFNKN